MSGTVRKICLKVPEEKLIPTMLDLMWADPAMKDEFTSIAIVKIKPESVSSTSRDKTWLGLWSQGALLSIQNECEASLHDLEVLILVEMDVSVIAKKVLS